jgi:hypothetical protein
MDTTLVINILLALTLYKFVLIPLHTLLSKAIFSLLRKVYKRDDGQTRSNP